MELFIIIVIVIAVIIASMVGKPLLNLIKYYELTIVKKWNKLFFRISVRNRRESIICILKNRGSVIQRKQ